jgi:hypothetical protein
MNTNEMRKIMKNKCKVKVKLFLCLTKHKTMKVYWEGKWKERKME